MLRPAALAPDGPILIVEDDPGLAELMSEQMLALGRPSVCLNTGQSAVAWLAEHQPSLMLLDYSLPDMTGLVLVDVAPVVPPFVVTTGRGDEQVAVAMMKLGARDYLVKDVSFLDRLPVAVANVLRELETERRLADAEAALRFTQFAVEHAADAMVWLDEAGRVVYANEATSRLLGHAHAALQTQTIFQLVPSVSPDDWRQNFARLCAAGSIQSETVLRAKDGHDVPVEVTANFVEFGGRRFNCVFARDMTARKQAADEIRRLNAELEQRVEDRTAALNAANAELSQANQALARGARLKDEFLASMSHELRTPLTGILGLSEALQMGIYGPLGEKQGPALRAIYESGQHLLDLITDILDLSKLEAGKLVLQPQWLEVSEVVEASLQFVKPTVQKKNQHITLTLDPAAKQVWADRRRLKQMLVNLLSNAVKFTPEGGALGLEVTLQAAAQKMGFTVWDKGIGIDPQKMGELFKPFVQLDAGLTRTYEGTGLGLSLVHRMAELHGGSVVLESEGVPGQGSRFTIWLPWSPSEPAVAGSLPAGTTPQRAALTRVVSAPLLNGQSEPRLVLLADDNALTLEVISDFLRAQAYQVATARTGLEALDLAQTLRPAAILMDIQMPGMDGLEVIRRLKANPALVATPMVVLTALAMAGDQERCLEAGADAYLPKPVNLVQLSQVLSALLKVAGRGQP